ncbi:MAG: RecX family transcriptional regulator [Bdellovibrionaceae bacterium]|nr:RecX family transcriptional regulator [Pseudobdellovibrionaceae bacterium]
MARSTRITETLVFAQQKAMDLLAVREHSEFELRRKLRQALIKTFSGTSVSQIDSAVDATISKALEKGWLLAADELSAQKVQQLHRKLKGIQYINQYLTAKGLPKVSVDWDLELEKALALLENKVKNKTALNKDKIRAARFLEARGYDPETVQKVIHEKF